MTPSAFDIAGAVVATPLAVSIMVVTIRYLRTPEPDGFVVGCATFLDACAWAWSIFCVSRVLGAHL